MPQFDLPAEEFADFLPDGELLAVPLVVEEKNSENAGTGAPVTSPSLDFNDNEDIPTELSDSSETHDEGTEQKSGVQRMCREFKGSCMWKNQNVSGKGGIQEKQTLFCTELAAS